MLLLLCLSLSLNRNAEFGPQSSCRTCFPNMNLLCSWHPLLSSQIMVLTDPEFESSVLISTDEGASFQKYRLSFLVLSLLFHPSEEDWALAYSHDQKVRLSFRSAALCFLFWLTLLQFTTKVLVTPLTVKIEGFIEVALIQTVKSKSSTLERVFQLFHVSMASGQWHLEQGCPNLFLKRFKMKM